jgi:hypothetical protein
VTDYIMKYPRTFKGFRPSPPEEYAEKGITNSGEVADYEGVIFSDGTVVLRWLTAFRSHSVWDNYNAFYQVHGHPEYGTRIEFSDGFPAPGEVMLRREASFHDSELEEKLQRLNPPPIISNWPEELGYLGD